MKNFRLEPGDDLLIVYGRKGSNSDLVWFNRVEPLIDELKGILKINGHPLSLKDSCTVPYLQVTRKRGKKYKFSMEHLATTCHWLIESLEMMIDEQELRKLHPEPLKT